MDNLPPKTDSPREPDSTTREKDTIRKSQEEYIGDMAEPSMDKSEYARRQGQESARPSAGGDNSAASRH